MSLPFLYCQQCDTIGSACSVCASGYESAREIAYEYARQIKDNLASNRADEVTQTSIREHTERLEELIEENRQALAASQQRIEDSTLRNDVMMYGEKAVWG